MERTFIIIVNNPYNPFIIINAVNTIVWFPNMEHPHNRCLRKPRFYESVK